MSSTSSSDVHTTTSPRRSPRLSFFALLLVVVGMVYLSAMSATVYSAECRGGRCGVRSKQAVRLFPSRVLGRRCRGGRCR